MSLLESKDAEVFVKYLKKESPINWHDILRSTSVDSLNADVRNLQSQVEQLKGEVAGKGELTQIQERLDDITDSIEKITERGQELKAKVLLPPPEYMNVQLVPSHSFERLEEYRSDEKKAYVLLGVFLGCVFGILSNWATQENLVWTKEAIVFVVLFVILTIGCGFWAWLINRRVVKVKNRMFPGRRTAGSDHVSDQNVSPRIEKEDSTE